MREIGSQWRLLPEEERAEYIADAAAGDNDDDGDIHNGDTDPVDITEALYDQRSQLWGQLGFAICNSE